jgi:hypothetical protein
LAVIAAFLCTGRVQVFAKRIQQRRSRIYLQVQQPTVDLQIESVLIESVLGDIDINDLHRLIPVPIWPFRSVRNRRMDVLRGRHTQIFDAQVEMFGSFFVARKDSSRNVLL